MMWMFPCPGSGTFFAFIKVAVMVERPGIDKGNIAVVLFRFLIDQAEDTFRAGKRHDNRVKLLRDLAERLVEASGHLQEGCNGSQRQRRDTGNGKKTSDQSSQNVVQVAQGCP